MPASLDLNLFPLARQEGQDVSSLPGLYTVTPPKRAFRHRSSDYLILFLSLTGNAPLLADQQEQILARLAQKYYKTKGSVTSAMQALAEAMNLYLLDRNLQSSASGQQVVGTLAIAVLRNDRLSLAHCGAMHTFLVSGQETQHFHDPQNNRGLGLTRSIPVRFYQISLVPNDVLMITSQPPPAWTSVILQNANGLGVDSLRRRLLSQAGTDVSALLIQAQSGSGKIRILHPKVQPSKPLPGTEPEEEIATEAVQPVEQAVPPFIPTERAEQADETLGPAVQPEAQPESREEALGPGGQPESLRESSVVVETLPDESVPETIPVPESTSQPQTKKGPIVSEQASIAGTGQTPAVHKARPRTQASPIKKTGASFSQDIDRLGLKMSNTMRSLARGIVSVARRILPDESLFSIPPSTMIFIAVAVPLLITIAGGVVYIQRGRGSLYQEFYDQALAAAQNAEIQQDPVEFRTAWESTLDYLDQAEIYRTTPESQALRTNAQNALDGLDMVVRLNFQPAISGGLAKGTEVSNIVTVGGDLYLLHSNGELVERAMFTGSGYEIDTNFICKRTPGIGPLIDIVAMPKGNDLKATVMAIDASGNLLYCIPEQTPMSTALKPPPVNWGNIKAIAIDGDDLYILDPPNNAVWFYRDMQIDQQPHLFFAEQIPPMQDTIDLTVNRDDLYLLHADGHVTLCVFSTLKESPTGCQEPADYSDPRSGRHSGPTIPDAQFNQIQYSPPPDPSIYMLDPIHQAIYHFSLKLSFQRQYRSTNPIPNLPATAFAISPNRTAFMAIGNQVYFAILP